LAGDVTSNSVVFGNDGNVGGTKIFTTTLSDSFVSSKPVATTADKDDEILIVRKNNGVDELRKIKQENLVATVPIIPVGMIAPYGGDVAPPGWLLCDGSVITTGSPYNRLFTAIGWRHDPTLTNGTTFRLPDYRGRFLLGNREMANVNSLGSPLDPNQPAPDANTVSDPEASQIGAKGGSSTASIEVENLPDHSHTLKGDEGTDFYAVSNVPNAPDTGVDSLSPNVAGELQSSNITQTGGVNSSTTGEDISIVNPYQTVNYIIYAGVAN